MPVGSDLQTTVVEAVHRALEEDLGSGDVTSTWTLSPHLRAQGYFLAKKDGVVAGLAVAREVFHQLDPSIQFTALVEDGTAVVAGQQIATIEGPAIPVLSGERTALNFLQRMSGIATAARHYVEAVAGTRAIVLDTRKTVPGLRALDKWAVALGGGQNHRQGLYDMVLIKDNHIVAAGSITQTLEQVRAQNQAGLPVEVEVKTLAELEEALAFQPPVDRIMLDNMTVEEMQEAVRRVDGRVPLEASGGVNLRGVRAIAETGVDYISVGALTHSVTALDISLELEPLA